MDQVTLDQLNAADDPEAWETPAGFNYWKEIGALVQVKKDLEAVSGLEFDLDREVQDASFFAELYIQSMEPVNLGSTIQMTIAIRFSSFGRLVTIWSSIPIPVSQDIFQEMIVTLERHGYGYVDSQSLQETYTGCHAGFQKDIGYGHPNWWDRFFNYN